MYSGKCSFSFFRKQYSEECTFPMKYLFCNVDLTMRYKARLLPKSPCWLCNLQNWAGVRSCFPLHHRHDSSRELWKELPVNDQRKLPRFYCMLNLFFSKTHMVFLERCKVLITVVITKYCNLSYPYVFPFQVRI